jgi:hypothetical protein
MSARHRQNQWKRMKDWFMYRHFPKIVDFGISLSVRKAENQVRSLWSSKVLIDTNVIGHSVTHETAWISTGDHLEITDTEVSHGYLARVPVHREDDISEVARSVRYLAPIAMLGKRGAITLWTSPELSDERLTQPVGRYAGYGYFDFNFLRGTPIGRLDDKYYVASLGSGEQSLDAQRRVRMSRKDDPIFLELARILGPKSDQDAWHIATAEAHGCYCLLTMDFKLLRSISAQKKNVTISRLRTKILSPEAFGEFLGLSPVSPRLLSFHDASFPVLPSESLPGSTRWPSRKRAE